MGVKLGHLAASGFAVSRSGDTCVLRGCLLGSVNFDRYKDLFAKASVIDFRDIAFAGWSGVESLLSFLRALPFNGRLVSVPSPLFEMMVLLGEKTDSFPIHTAHLTAASLEFSNIVQVPVDLDSWKGFAEQCGTAAADEISPGFRYVGCLETFIFPSDAVALSDDARSAPQGVGTPGSEESFAFLYASFLHTIALFTINHVETVAAGCLHSAEEILARLEKANGALALLKCDDGISLPKRKDVAAPLIAGFEEAISSLEAIERLTRGLVLKLQAVARSKGGLRADPLSLATLLGTLSEACDTFCQTADAIGVSTFSNLVSLSCGDAIKTALARVDGSKLNEESLKATSEAFFVLDLFAAESWETLRPEIDTELDLVDALVMNLVVDVQGFDAAKQVIEQRARELRHWKLALETHKPSAGPEGLISVVSSKLVTVPERVTFGLLLGHFKALEQARMEGLEVTFFAP